MRMITQDDLLVRHNEANARKNYIAQKRTPPLKSFILELNSLAPMHPVIIRTIVRGSKNDNAFKKLVFHESMPGFSPGGDSGNAHSS